jgi:HAD superfamily hydrolase (TIGR01509 family)
MHRASAGMKQETATLVLDIGGVVYLSRPTEAFHERWAARCGYTPDALADRLLQGPHWLAAELGQITSQQCIDICAERVDVDRALAREMIFAAWASDPDEILADVVSQLRARGIVVAALTNNTSRESKLLARPELARLFDLAISSADAGFRKPDQVMFRHAEERLGAIPDALIFVDDVETNVVAARAVGWHAVHHGSTAETIAAIKAKFEAHAGDEPAS